MLILQRCLTAVAVSVLISASSYAQAVPAAAATAANEAAQAGAGGPKHGALDNLEVFAGLDGSKQPQDLGINANMGVRVSANMGVPVVASQNLGLQFGAALNQSDAAVHVLDQIEGTSSRTQTFFTVGLFQRPGEKLNWALAYDGLVERYYDTFALGQMRGSAGYQATSSIEIGAWFAKGLHGDNGVMGQTPVRLDPISQVSGYVTRRWPTQARTTLWMGMANGHQDIVWVLPANPRDNHVLVYGAELDLPLSDRFAVTGAANFLTPTATGTVDAFLGLTLFPGRNANSANRGTFVPHQGVANNPTFAVNMRR